jgi:hypothetical protein
MRAARKCARLHHYSYNLCIKPTREAEELAFGTLVHKGLEQWWRARLAGGEGDALLDAAISVVRGESADPFDLVRAEVMLAGYHLRWKDDGMRPLAVEAKFLTPLVNPDTGAMSRTFALGGKIDVLVEDASGRKLLMEHKTSSEDIGAGSEYWRRLRMDGQVSTYFDGAAALGIEVEACIYDVLGKPAQRPYKATPLESRKFKANGELYANQRANDETVEEYRQRIGEAVAEDPARYFQRGEVVRLDEEMVEARADRWEQARIIRENELAARHPRNPDACSQYGRLCPFFDVCSGTASLDDPTRFTRAESAHPELAEVSSVQQAPEEGATA